MRNPDARWERLRAAGPWVLDGGLAVAATAVGFALLATMLPFDPGSPRAWAAYLLVAAHTLPVAVRRRFPLPALAWGVATGVAFAALGLSLVALSFTILIYVYTAAAHCPRRVSLAGLAATEAVLLLVWLVNPGAIGDGGTVVIDGLIMAAAWWLGDGARRRQEAIVTAQQRAAELEQAREELARRAVTDRPWRVAVGIVVDRDAQRRRLVAQPQQDGRVAGVLADVGQGLLHDAVRRQVDRRRQRTGGTVDVGSDAQSGAAEGGEELVEPGQAGVRLRRRGRFARFAKQPDGVP